MVYIKDVFLYPYSINLGLSIKDVRSQGRGGVLHMRTSAFFGAKYFGFFESYGVSVRTKGERIEPMRIFFGQGERSVFRDFVRIFYERPLSNFFLFYNQFFYRKVYVY